MIERIVLQGMAAALGSVIAIPAICRNVYGGLTHQSSIQVSY